ncbi:MAG: MFS transporter [Myxococcales bacterium]|nr:MFS transporter [Myxococcales bacterium]
MVPRVSRGAVVATLVGNTLEFYDFIAYTFFAVYIGRAFFPTDSAVASLLLSVATFGIGFLTRPLGAVWIGAYADRVGRKPALLLTIALMSVGTLGLVATPSYASIGLAAPIILMVSRLVQGLALGGEVGPANAVLIECAPPGQRALYMSLQSASQGIATMASGVVGLVIASALTEDQLASWGWRLPFAAGLVLIPVGLYMRRTLPETLPEPKHATAGAALRAVWTDHRREVLLLVLVTASSTITTYVLNYMTTFATKTLGMSAFAGMVAPIAMGVMIVVMAPIAGLICERFGRRETLIVSRVLTIALAVPAFLYLIHERSIFALVMSVVVLTVVAMPATVVNLTVMAEVFPPESRGAGIALTYATAVTVFGATTQFVITWLLDVTGSPLAPAYYAMAAAAMSVLAALSLFAGIARRATAP